MFAITQQKLTILILCRLGLVAGPVELGKQASPMLKRYESRQDGLAQPRSPIQRNGVPHAAGQVALSSAKGLGRVVTAGLKCPMTFMNGLTRGFHNLPKSYGEQVREYENVTGLRSGLLVSAKVSAIRPRHTPRG